MENEIIKFRKIGTLYSPHKNTEDMPRQPKFAKGIRGTVVIEPEFIEGLRDLEGFSHIYLICYLHKVEAFKLSSNPPMDNQSHGVFATRSPHRPNPISLSIVKLVSIEGDVLTIEDVDLLDGTPVLDIKPYSPPFNQDEPIRTGWLESATTSEDDT
jgi:tRNA-Thr(GGU) m(6)t(6)A37 methyltransferase TsaA